MRDMSKIAKLEFLLPRIADKMDRALKEYEAHLERYQADPFGCLEWGDHLFKAAAEHRLWFRLHQHMLTVQKLRSEGRDDLPNEFTMDELRKIVDKEFEHSSCLPRSSNASHNLVHAHLVELVRQFVGGRAMWDRWFWDAQVEDPEYAAFENARMEKHRVEQAKEQALKDVQAAVARRAMNAARKRVKELLDAEKAPTAADVQLGWPSGRCSDHRVQNILDRIEHEKLAAERAQRTAAREAREREYEAKHGQSSSGGKS